MFFILLKFIKNKTGIAFVIQSLTNKDKHLKLNHKEITMNIQSNNKTFNNTLFVATIVATLSATSVLAHNSCDVELEAGININSNSIEFFNEKKKNTLYKIDKDENLILDGETIDLDDEQQALVTQYSTRIKAMVPQTRNIVIEGVNLALEGVNLAFDELLGEGNDVGADLSYELSKLKTQVSTRFTLANGVTIGEDGLEGDELLGDEFEQRIESTVEKAIMRSMGSIMMALGQEMISSGGDSNAFETRMENFGEYMEHEMEARADKIEQEANKLCIAVVEIDKLEEQLKAIVEPLADINVISAHYNERESHHHDNSAM